MMPHN